MKIWRDGKLTVDTDKCPDCSCYNCPHQCYERDAKFLHTQERNTRIYDEIYD